MANNECCDPQPVRGGGGGGGGPIVLAGDVTGPSNANIAERSSEATFPINAILAGPTATLRLHGATGDTDLASNGTDLALTPGVAGGNADVGNFAAVRLRNASQLRAESTVPGTYRALIYLDGTNTIQLGDAAVPLNVRGTAGTCAVPFVWSALQTFTGTAGPNNAGIQIGVGTESTGANTGTYWGIASANAADGAHRGTYFQLRAGKGFSASGVTAATPGGNLAALAGDGGDGSATLAAANGRHAGLLAGNAGVNNGGGGALGGFAQVTGGNGTGANAGGDAQVDGGASASGTAGRVLIGTNASSNFGVGPTPGTSAVVIGRTGITTTVNGTLQTANGPAGVKTANGTVLTDQNGFGNPGYGDLATVGGSVSVTLAVAMTVVVTISAIIYNKTGAGFTAYVSVAASGATVIAASDNNATISASPGGSFAITVSVTVALALNAGTTTLTMKYKRDNAGQDWHALNRSISVAA